jgi:hypothetical protein
MVGPINNHEQKQSLATKAIKDVFRPIVKLMLSQQINYTYVADILKELFVEVAESELSKIEKRVADARISLSTGVHRKDVKRLRSTLNVKSDEMPQSISLGIKILGKWSSDPHFLDSESNPLPLKRLKQDNDEPTFESLVTSVSKDIHPRAVLDEWLRLGIAYIDNTDLVRIKTDAFIPQTGFEEKMFFLTNNLKDHANAAVHNVLNAGAPFLERCVLYDDINPNAIQKLSKLAGRVGMKALREVNTIAAQNSFDTPQGNSLRMTFGVYMYYEPSQTTDNFDIKNVTESKSEESENPQNV